MPLLCGNPVYMWAQMELKQIFGIASPLNKDTAEEIWEEANETLKTRLEFEKHIFEAKNKC